MGFCLSAATTEESSYATSNGFFFPLLSGKAATPPTFRKGNRLYIPYKAVSPPFLTAKGSSLDVDGAVLYLCIALVRGETIHLFPFARDALNSYPFVPLVFYHWDSTFLGDGVRDQIGSYFASKGSCVCELDISHESLKAFKNLTHNEPGFSRISFIEQEPYARLLSLVLEKVYPFNAIDIEEFFDEDEEDEQGVDIITPVFGLAAMMVFFIACGIAPSEVSAVMNSIHI